MATNFPTSLDSLTNPTAVDTLDSPPHDEQHADANDAIEALQAKVGIDSSAVTSSLDYKVANFTNKLGSGSGNTYPWSNGEELHAADLNAAIKGNPRVLVHKAVDQALNNVVYNTITFDIEVFDDFGMHSTVTNTERLTIPTGWGGYWLFVASGATNAGTLSITFLVNGVSRLSYAGQCGTIGGGSAILELNAGDYVEWSGYAISASTLYGSNSIGGYASSFAATWIGAA